MCPNVQIDALDLVLRGCFRFVAFINLYFRCVMLYKPLVKKNPFLNRTGQTGEGSSGILILLDQMNV